MRNLIPMTDYELRMAAVNDIGQSKWSNLLTITTEEEGKFFFISVIKNEIKILILIFFCFSSA